MKKLWVAAVVLAVLLGSGIGSALVMQKVHQELSHSLNQAAELAQSDWDTAKALADAARAKWEKDCHVIAALADHEPLEQLDGLFAELAVYQKTNDRQCFAAVCVRIASLADMLRESHSPCWWNLL